ncbi:MAG: response regulator [Chloroflexi bacterium]|nr:response regulator [Chloroflexota bacterium]
MMGGPTVLIVDDSVSTCLFIATALQQAGYEVDIALTGEEGLTRIAKFRPQCLILDVLLPDISGYAICRYVRQSIPAYTVPIILISSKKALLDASYGLRQGADRYLPKPFTAQTIVKMVWEVIPYALRGAVLPELPVVQQQRMDLELSELIPHRVPNREAMRTSSPFARLAVGGDEQTRRLYAAIDGKRTITELAVITGLETREAFRTLCVLLRENYIQIYNSSGQLVESDLVLSAL